MSRFGTVTGGFANTRSFIVQGATPEALIAASAAAGFKTFGSLLNPVITSISLTGAGDGSMFFLEVQGAAGANAQGGLDAAAGIGTAFILAADAETLTKQLQAVKPQSPTASVVDMQIAGASQGQRVMGLVIFGTLLGAGGGECCVTWRPDGLGDVTTFAEVMVVVGASKGPVLINMPQVGGPIYAIPPGASGPPVVYDMKGSIFKGPQANHDKVPVQIQRGATLFNLGEITNAIRLQTNKLTGDPPALTFPANPGGSWTFAVTRGAEIKNIAGTPANPVTQPMIMVPSTNEFYVAFSELGTADVDQSADAFSTVFAPAGTILNIVAISGGLSLDTIQRRGWIGSEVGATVNWIHDGTMAFPLGPPEFWDNTGAGYHPTNLGQNNNQPTGCIGGMGPTSKRPVFQDGGNCGFGCMYFDQQLAGGSPPGLPIWFNGSAGTGWVDATGASV